jgi:dTDP-4-dehydrorhamnose 3,5-epimerase
LNFIPTAIPDIILIEPQVHSDERGFFMETYQVQEFTQAGISGTFVQDNHSGSRQGILRGLHYQIKQPQGKLVRVVQGEVFDVAVDLRRNSPTFSKWEGILLSAENHRQLWIPEGFAHGYYVLSDWADLIYKVTNYYAPAWERTILWNDPELNIRWPLIANQMPQLSEKDAGAVLLSEAELFDRGG